MRPEYIFKINSVYSRTVSDDIEINTDSASNKKWKNGYKTFKNNIRRHLKIQQNGRCAFCRCYINTGSSYSNLEHLVSKDNYPQFEFLPSNLAYCCWLCNRPKGTRNTLSNPVSDRTLQQFPANSSEFLIVNPYYDNYEDHIEFIDEIIIVKKNNSSKGGKTIEFYNLARPELAEDRAREFKLNQNTIYHQLTQRLTSAASFPEVLEQINNIIAQMPSWTLPL
jgi:uncharacterized protein (TIGR02646 family)